MTVTEAAASAKTTLYENIARVAHETNRAYCTTIGDDSQVAWEDAPDWQRKSAFEGVKFCWDNPDAPASANHDSWLAVKEADGWKYGEFKDVEKKEHPCFVPYDQLPAEQRLKDHLFKAIIGAFSADFAPEGK